LLFKLF
jgi:importin subunit alpha-6/7